MYDTATTSFAVVLNVIIIVSLVLTLSLSIALSNPQGRTARRVASSRASTIVLFSSVLATLIVSFGMIPFQNGSYSVTMLSLMVTVFGLTSVTSVREIRAQIAKESSETDVSESRP